MNGCDVIVGSWGEDLGRGRTLQRPRGYLKRQDSLMELCEFTIVAHTKLEAAEHTSLQGSLEDSTASPGNSALISSASQPSPSEHSVDTPSTSCSIPEHHEPGMGYAGWKDFSGRSRAPSPWIARDWREHPATPGRVRRFVRGAKASYKAFKLRGRTSRAAICEKVPSKKQ